MKIFISLSFLLVSALVCAQKSAKLTIDGFSITIPGQSVATAKSMKQSPETNAVIVNEMIVTLAAETAKLSIVIFPMEVSEQNDSTEMANRLLVEGSTFDENAQTSTMILKKQMYLSKTSTWIGASKETVTVKQMKTFFKDQLYIIYVWGSAEDMKKEQVIQHVLSWCTFSKFTKM
jgi:hypothetical protein